LLEKAEEQGTLCERSERGFSCSAPPSGISAGNPVIPTNTKAPGESRGFLFWNLSSLLEKAEGQETLCERNEPGFWCSAPPWIYAGNPVIPTNTRSHRGNQGADAWFC
jgi:hypothetical protein